MTKPHRPGSHRSSPTRTRERDEIDLLFLGEEMAPNDYEDKPIGLLRTESGHVTLGRARELRQSTRCEIAAKRRSTATRGRTPCGSATTSFYGGEELPVPVEAIAEDMLGLSVREVPRDGVSGCSIR
jgi:hypothetical protein